jgi:hypothetical protein
MIIGSGGRPTAHRQGRGWRGGFLASSLEHSLKLDLKKWLILIRDLQLLPLLYSQDWSNVFLQKFEGSITIIPKVSMSDYFHIITDPSRERLERYIRHGALNTFPKLHMIQNRLEIEQAIDLRRDALKRRLKNKEK